MKGRSTRYSSSLLWKKAQMCRERSRTEPASRTCLGLLIARLLSVNALRGRFRMQALRHRNDGSRARQSYPKRDRKEARGMIPRRPLRVRIKCQKAAEVQDRDPRTILSLTV